MCELSVNGGVDKTECDDWNDGVAEWVQNQTMNAHENEKDKNWRLEKKLEHKSVQKIGVRTI